jgi:hypothetical protein
MVSAGYERNVGQKFNTSGSPSPHFQAAKCQIREHEVHMVDLVLRRSQSNKAIIRESLNILYIRFFVTSLSCLGPVAHQPPGLGSASKTQRHLSNPSPQLLSV